LAVSGSGWRCEKNAQYVAQPIFCHNWCITLSVGNKAAKCLCYFSNFQNTCPK
jgi:hypothetical protein